MNERHRRFGNALIQFIHSNRPLLMTLSAAVVFITAYLLILPAATLDTEEAADQGGIDLPQAQEQELLPLNCETDNASICAAFDAKAGLPEDTELAASLIGEEEADYEALREEALQAVQSEEGGDSVTELKDAWFYDISLLSGGEPVEPDAPVDVTISYDKPLKVSDADHLRIVHFGEDGAQMLDPDEVSFDLKKGKLRGAAFPAESFSVYAVVYTVDFHWEVNGKMYDFSIPGGGFVSFTDLVEVLGIAKQDVNGDFDEEVEDSEVTVEGSSAAAITADSGTEAPLTLGDITVSEETRKFVENVESVVPSNTELLSVSKVDDDTTVGAIKDGLELECEYSAELTEEQIEEINGQTVEAGDWAVISVQPFMSEESLTVTMKNGDQFVVRVTDAQISTHVLTASGDTYKITVTYDDTAEIPDNAELRAREITEEDENYQALLEEADQALTEKYDTGLENPILFDIGIYVDDEEIEPAEGSMVKVEIWLANDEEDEPQVDSDAIADQENDNSDPGVTSDNADTTDEINGYIELTDDVQGLWFNGAILNPDEEQKTPIIVHHKDDGTVDIIDELKVDLDENGETLSFDTDSFSGYSIGNTGLYLTDTLGNQTLYVGDEIYYNGNNIRITTGNDTVASLESRGDSGNNHYKVIKLKEDGQIQIRYGYTTGYNGEIYGGTTVNATVKKYPYQNSKPNQITNAVTNEEAGISLDIFEYDLDGVLNEAWNNGSTPQSKWYLGQYVNAGKNLKFWTACPGYDDYNNGWTGVGDHTFAPNIVSNKLSGGYPSVGGQSLDYLFDSTVTNSDRRDHLGADGLFKYENGYYVYDSSVNYAWLNDDNKFEVYDTTYTYGNKDINQNTGTPIGFFPFHPYNAENEKTIERLSGHQQMNHHFGMSMSAKFAIPADGLDINGKPIIYEFSGDDDMWVYIDDDLTLDLGGIHQPVSGRIEFIPTNDGKIEVRVSTKDKGSDTWVPQQRSIKLTPNKEYTLRSFYIERGGGDSNCKIMFNLPTYRTLKLAKRLNGLSEKEYAKYKDEWFTYELNMRTGTANEFSLYRTPDEARVSATNPNPEYDLRPIVRDAEGYIIGSDGQRIGGGTKVETKDNKAQARWMIVDDGQIKIKDGWTVEIPHLSRSDNFYVAEEKTINMDEFEDPHAERDYYTNTDGEHHEEEIHLDPSTSVGENPDEHKHLQDWKTDTYKLQETEKVTFTNTLKEKNIDVEKDWSDGKDAHADDSITFRLVARIPDGSGEGLYTQVHGGNIWGKVTGEVNGNSVLDPHEEEVLLQQYTLSAKNDWKMRFEHLPAVTENDKVITYSVEEVSTTPGYVTSDPSSVETYDVDVFKYFPDNTYPNETITFRLLKDGQYYTGSGWSSSAGDAKSYTLQRSNVQDESYHCRFTDMPDGTYTVEEIGDTNVLTKGLVIYKRSLKKFTILNMRFSDITARKVWLKEDGTTTYTDAELVALLGEEALNSIKITGELWEKAANATDYTKVEDFTLDRVHGWAKTWLKDNLHEGSVYQIRNVQETPANIEGFSFSNNGVASFDSNGNIIYSYQNTKEKTTDKLPVEKNWSGDTSFMPSSITVVLQKKASTDDDWVDADNKLILTAPEWKGEFENLPIKDSNGQPIQYRVRELGVGGWTTAYSTNNGQTLEHPETITITNTRTTTEPGTTTASVKKVWKVNDQVVDSPNDDDAVQVKLVRYKAKPAAVNTIIHSYYYYQDPSANYEVKFAKLADDITIEQSANSKLGFSPLTINHNGEYLYILDENKIVNGSWDFNKTEASYQVPHNGSLNEFTFDSTGKSQLWIVAGAGWQESGSITDLIKTLENKNSSGSSNTAGKYEIDETYKYSGEGADPNTGFVTLNSSNSWQYEFANLPKEETIGGQKWLYRYAIEEVTTGSFTTTTTGDSDTIDLDNDQSASVVPNGGQVTITNTKTTKDFTFHKVWYPLNSSTEKQTWQKDITVTLYKENDVPVVEYVISMVDGSLLYTATSKISGEEAPTLVINQSADFDYSFTIKDLPAAETFYLKEAEMEMNLLKYGKKGSNGIEIAEGSNRATEDTPYIINKDTGGYELPSTGGPGTTALYLLGSILITMAGVGLVMRRRKKLS